MSKDIQEASAEAEVSEYPATVMVHWPSGPVPCCDRHGNELVELGNFLGTHVVATFLHAPAECANCRNEVKA